MDVRWTGWKAYLYRQRAHPRVHTWQRQLQRVRHVETRRVTMLSSLAELLFFVNRF